MSEDIDKIKNELEILRKENRELKKARDIWRITLQSISAYVLITDFSGNIVLQNKTFNNFKSNKIYDLLPSEIDWNLNGSYELKLFDEWVTITISDLNFTFHGKAIVISNISELKKAQDELQKAQEQLIENSKKEIGRLSLAVEQSPATIVISDINGIVEYVNPSFEKTTEYPFSEIVGNNQNILKSGYHDKEFYKKLWDTIQSGSEWHGEFLNKKKNGDLYWESASISPLVNSKNEITSYVKVAEDITKRKEAEDTLRQAKEMAETANKAKSDFLASMSHEIRTPLNGIQGLSETILRFLKADKSNWGKLTPKLLEKNLIGITSSVKLLSGIITDILDISKIEAGKMEVYMDEVVISQIMDEIFSSLEYLAKFKGLYLNLEIDDNLKILADKNKFYQVINNLIGNAIKFTSEGGITIKTIEEENFAVICISDTGVGISKKNMKYIFDRFSRVDKSGFIPGTGLGLSITKELVKIMNGEIWVKSQIGKGSDFYIKFEKAKEGENNE